MVPRIVHQIWLGDDVIPDQIKDWMGSWKRYLPAWRYKLWTDADLEELRPRLRCPDIFESNQNVGLKSDVLRMEILRQFGGLYADCDFECFQSMEHLLRSDCFHYGEECDGQPGNAWLCSPPDHRVPTLFLEQLRHTCLSENVDMWRDWNIVIRKTGPEALRRLLNYWVGEWRGSILHHRGAAVGILYPGNIVAFSRQLLYPYWGDWRTFSKEEYPDAIAAHHWAGSWKTGMLMPAQDKIRVGGDAANGVRTSL
jgi:hypothetical protein